MSGTERRPSPNEPWRVEHRGKTFHGGLDRPSSGIGPGGGDGGGSGGGDGGGSGSGEK